MLSDSESVKHLFFFCPRYAAQSHVILTSAASTLGETWSLSSYARNINFFIVLGIVNLCQTFWPMSEACEIAQPVDVRLGKVTLFIKLLCYCVAISALDLCVYFSSTL